VTVNALKPLPNQRKRKASQKSEVKTMREKDLVTPEQIEKAREVDLLEFLQRTEPNNLKSSAPGEYRLIDHDSLKISKGKFHWFSRGIGGTNAIDFLVKVRGMEFKAAVRELAGEDFTYSADKRAPPTIPKRESSTAQDYVPFFELPTANSHNDNVIGYLKERGIEETVITACIEERLLYQSKAYRKPLFHKEGDENKPLYHDVDGQPKQRYESIKGGCVFVGYDNQHSPKFACERATDLDYKKDVFGSSKEFAFCMPPTANDLHSKYAPERLYVFEGAIDCLSHASITQISGTDWDGYRLSLGGVSSLALTNFLDNNPQITNVYLCLDNDKPGKDATERISSEIISNEKYSHISLYIVPPPIGKDYNDRPSRPQRTPRRWHKRKQLLHTQCYRPTRCSIF